MVFGHMFTCTTTVEGRFVEAFAWLCNSRKKHPPDSDIWQLMMDWPSKSRNTIESFVDGTFKFGLQKKITFACGDTIAMWSSIDSLVIKVLTGMLQDILTPCLSEFCYHLKGHGGLRGAVRDVIESLPNYMFCCRTEVKSYYDSIDHTLLMVKLHERIDNKILTGYVWQFLNRCVEWGGLYQNITRGIPRGSSLSPLLGLSISRILRTG